MFILYGRNDTPVVYDREQRAYTRVVSGGILHAENDGNHTGNDRFLVGVFRGKNIIKV